jgi:Mannosyltransferase (PIG-V)
MNQDTAETVVVAAPEGADLGVGAAALAIAPPRAGARARAEDAHALALRESLLALVGSRLLVWVAGVGTVLSFGYGPTRKVLDPAGITRGLGRLGELLAAPAARWDAAWYLVIAHYGYRPDLSPYTSSRTAFFPLYPLGIGALSGAGLPPILAGVLLSLAALWASLYGIHRLTALELEGAGAAPGVPRGGVARMAVLLTAFAPMAFFLSAVYSESLYLALSVGVFWFARKGRWAAVGVLGALAAATRSAGVLLLAPALILYLYGPREDGPADREPGGAIAGRIGGSLGALAPRYRLRRDVLWLGLLPAGLGLYLAYLGLAGGDPLMPFHAQQVWSRHFVGPFVAIWDGGRAALEGARQLLSFQRAHLYFPLAGSSPSIEAAHNILLFVFLGAAIPMIVGVARRLPLAYAAYVVAALALPLSYPVATQPLMSLPRFLLVLFPLNMWLALVLARHRRLALGVLVLFALSMAFFTAQFATWHWVA